MKNTKIVCTIGPTCDSEDMLRKMLKKGMNVARLNFSHNTHAYHKRTIKKIRKIAQELGLPVSIIQDLQGPRIRLGTFNGEKELKPRAKIILTTGRPSKDKIPVTYTQMHADVKKGQRIFIADGTIELIINSIRKKDIKCTVRKGGKIISNKGMNLPDSKISLPALAVKDKKDLMLGLKKKVDFIALSFVRNAEEVKILRRLINKHDKKPQAKILVKIERKEALKNFDKILDVADGVMIARGDLGIELPPEDVPIIQKKLIDKCLQAAKPVIVATQMLESMTDSPRPTRAEASDVANAVIDHTDAVMLSAETAFGNYPLEAVAVMSRIISKTEKSTYDNLVIQEKVKKIIPNTDAVGRAAKSLAEKTKAKMILVTSLSGESARIVSRYRPELPIFVACTNERVKRQLNLSWGLVPFVLSECRTIVQITEHAEKYLKQNKFIKKGEQIIMISGGLPGKSGNLDLVEIKKI